MTKTIEDSNFNHENILKFSVIYEKFKISVNLIDRELVIRKM